MNTNVINTNDHVFDVSIFEFHFENSRVYNLATNKDYNGRNRARLEQFCRENNFKYTIFLSFKQAQSLGLRVKRGSHGCKIFAGGVKDEIIKDKNGNIVMDNMDTPKTEKIFCGHWLAPVFNIEQFELWTDDDGNKFLNSDSPNTDLFNFFANNLEPVSIVHKETKTNSSNLIELECEHVQNEPIQTELCFETSTDKKDDCEQGKQCLKTAIIQLYEDIVIKDKDIDKTYIKLMQAMKDIATDLLIIK